MERAKLLWIDLRIATRHGEISQVFHEYFDVTHVASLSRVEEDPQFCSGVALCFEFDYPGQAGLSALRETKQRHPHIPILMLTAQHSEQLAVWAYRNRVLDYLVKPVPKEDLRRCRDMLLAIQSPSERQPRRQISDFHSEVTIVDRGSQWNHDGRLSPALAYVRKNFRGKIRNSDVARVCNMSAFHFSHEFTQTFDLTFQEFVLRYRIAEACKELQYPNVSVSHVAYSVGFNDPSYFARVFRRFIKQSPSEYCDRVACAEPDREIREILRQLEMPDLQEIAQDRHLSTMRSSGADRRRQSA